MISFGCFLWELEVAVLITLWGTVAEKMGMLATLLLVVVGPEP